MTLPRKLTLRETPEGIRLFQAPVDELQELSSGKLSLSGNAAKINSAFALTDLNSKHTYQLQSTLEMAKASDAGWKILAQNGTYTLVGYDKQKGVLYVDRSHSGITPVSDQFFTRIEAPLNFSGALALDLVVDRCSVELFANHGAVTMTNLVFPNSGKTTIEFYTKGGDTGTISAHLTQLKSAH
jgi:levanbiose-producing levanase